MNRLLKASRKPLALFMAVLTLIYAPLTSYADTGVATSSDADIDEDYGISTGDLIDDGYAVNDGTSLDYDSFGNAYGPAEYVTYGDDDAGVVYSGDFDPVSGTYTDLEISDSNIYERYQKSLEYFPLTDYEQGVESTSIVGSLTLTFFASLLISWGVKVASGALSSLFTKFLTLARERFGDNEACMSALDKLASLKAGVVLQIGLIKTMFLSLKNDLFGDNGKTYTTDGTENVRTEPFNSKLDDYIADYNVSKGTDYVYAYTSFSDPSSSSRYTDILLPNSNCKLLCFYVDGRSLYGYYYDDVDCNYYTGSLYKMIHSYDSSLNAFTYATSVSASGYSLGSSSTSSSELLERKKLVASQVPVPIFSDITYATQYVKYGQTDGIITADGTTYNNTDTSAIASQATTAENVVVQNESAYADIVNDATDDEDDDSYIARVVAAVLALLGTQANVDVGTDSGTDSNTGSDSNSSVDLSGVLGYLASILSILGGVTTLVSSVGGISDFISDIKNNVATILSTIGVLSNIYSVLLDIPTAINNVLITAMEISTKLSEWTFADWKLALGDILTTFVVDALVGGTLGSAVGLLTNINTDILDGFDVVGDVLSNLINIDSLIFDLKQLCDIDNWGQTLGDIILGGLTGLGVGGILGSLQGLSDIGSVISDLLSNTGLDLSGIKDLLQSLLDSLSGIISGVLTGLGLASLAGLISQIIELITSLTDVVKNIGSGNSSDNQEEFGEGDTEGLGSFFNIFYILILILIMLCIIFYNCLRFIVFIFQIPASTELLNDDVLAGIEYLKSIDLPLFNISLYNLLLVSAYCCSQTLFSKSYRTCLSGNSRL
jgi:hypothetical protein